MLIGLAVVDGGLPTGEPGVLDGHAFIVEAAVCLGGKDTKSGINVFRFANRIPLLFEVGSSPSRLGVPACGLLLVSFHLLMQALGIPPR